MFYNYRFYFSDCLRWVLAGQLTANAKDLDKIEDRNRWLSGFGGPAQSSDRDETSSKNYLKVPSQYGYEQVILPVSSHNPNHYLIKAIAAKMRKNPRSWPPTSRPRCRNSEWAACRELQPSWPPDRLCFGSCWLLEMLEFNDLSDWLMEDLLTPQFAMS